MKIAVSSIEKSINSDISEVFGRCPYFIIAQIENNEVKETEAIENKGKDQMSGAGIFTSQMIAEREVEAVITKNIGPRALDILRQFNIKVYSGEGLIKEALQKFIEGKLERID
jgi:predicted Fe-Mo cluster-binding NifX family protein